MLATCAISKMRGLRNVDVTYEVYLKMKASNCQIYITIYEIHPRIESLHAYLKNI